VERYHGAPVRRCRAIAIKQGTYQPLGRAHPQNIASSASACSAAADNRRVPIPEPVRRSAEEYVDLFDNGDSEGWIPIACNLSPGAHTVVVEVLGTSNGASGNPRIDIDAFVVLN
jgi:hypothetical protein